MLKEKIKKYYDCGQRDYTPEAAEAIMNILRGRDWCKKGYKLAKNIGK